MQPLRVALDARVSSGQQVTDATIASQIAALDARLAQDGVRVLSEHRFIDDRDSGNTVLRPALERLRDAVATGLVDRLYVHSPDRLARRYAYQVVLMDEVRRAGTEVVFLNRAIGVSADDDLLRQGPGIVAEYERAKILEGTVNLASVASHSHNAHARTRPVGASITAVRDTTSSHYCVGKP
ncbi:recombinase family protein [Azospirillum canadense]|uniref:recombinase family protein n=1 Tax=Azospirillum canadense TaxID=403962 RepID=UPI0022270B2A|nr:recombinase family protein [Azospirillum canadense]MCW2240531.1 DNA invertase Pin-like site-specific DNA recombinase [Azospirillum canadense]